MINKEKLWSTLLNLTAGATKPFAKGANILAQGYGDLYRGLSGNTQAVSPLESYIKSGISEEDMDRIERNPYKEILKSGAGMAATLAPMSTAGVFTNAATKGTRAFQNVNTFADPLANQLSQILLRGGFEGALGGLGRSREGREFSDTLKGAGLGMAGELVGTYVFDKNFRELANTYGEETAQKLWQGMLHPTDNMLPAGTTIPGDIVSKLKGASGDVDLDVLRDNAYKTLKLEPMEEAKLNALYTNAGSSHDPYLTDIELFQRSSVKSVEMRDYLLALRERGIVEPSQIDLSLKDYNIDPKELGKFQQMLGDNKNTLTNIKDMEPEIIGGEFTPSKMDLQDTVANRNKLADYMDTSDVPEPDAFKEILKTYQKEGFLPKGKALTEYSKTYDLSNPDDALQLSRILDEDAVDKFKGGVYEYGRYKNKDDIERIVNANILEDRSTVKEFKDISKFKTAEDFIKNKFSAPDYTMQHRPTEGSPAYDIAKGGDIPEDFYNHPEWYANMSDDTYKESFSVLKKIRNKPDMDVKIYRASSKKELNPGDWITLSKKYAEEHANRVGGKVNTFLVKVKDVAFAGDDINEFGYYPRETLKKLWEKASRK